jgi:Fe-S oxidoreductase/nitrate reductase gamma subunit
MEFSREIYWNVGHSVATLLPMYLLAVLALVVAGMGFVRRIAAYRQAASLDRRDHLVRRVIHCLSQVLLQRRVVRGSLPGAWHGLLFWSLVLLAIGTTLIFIQADLTDPLFAVRFLTGTFYLLFSLVLDLAGLVAITMILLLAGRRYLARPEGLPSSLDHLLMHGLLLAILSTGFLIEGARMATTEMESTLRWWSPGGLLIAQGLSHLPSATVLQLHRMLWWLHLALTMLLIGVLPVTRFRHILTTSVNYLFDDLGPKGKLASLDLEDEEQESFGANQIHELSWKDLLDGDACTQCMRCQDRCPAYNTGKPLSPMAIVHQVQETTFSQPSSPLTEVLGREALWACTTCRACQEACPASIEHLSKIIAVRRHMVLMEGTFPGEEVMTAMEATEVNANPLGMGYATRGDWASELGIPLASEATAIDYLYFVGCYASLDRRNIAVAKAFVRLCQAAGIRIAILGKEEKCCGEPMRKMGNEYLFQRLALENIALIADHGIERIVTTCPHCYNTLNKEYRDFGLEAEVVPAVTLLEGLLLDRRLVLAPQPLACTYHDSCYLGRHNDLYQGPRTLLAAAGATVQEMAANRAESFCCGAGGGRILAEERLGERINVKRTTMAADTGTQVLVSSCPFCLTMFEDGVKVAGLDKDLRPLDLIEILADRLEAPPHSRT